MEKIDYAEVAKHNTPGDAWVVVENQVRSISFCALDCVCFGYAVQ